MAEGYVLPTYAAVEIAVAAAAGGTTGIGLFGRLDEDEFKTAIGAFRFNPKGDLTKSRSTAPTRYEGGAISFLWGRNDAPGRSAEPDHRRGRPDGRQRAGP